MVWVKGGASRSPTSFNFHRLTRLISTPNGMWVFNWSYLIVFVLQWHVYCNVYATVMLLCWCSRNCASSLWLPAEAPMRVVKNGARPFPRRVSQVLARLNPYWWFLSLPLYTFLIFMHPSVFWSCESSFEAGLHINYAAANSTITAPYHSPQLMPRTRALWGLCTQALWPCESFSYDWSTTSKKSCCTVWNGSRPTQYTLTIINIDASCIMSQTLFVYFICVGVMNLHVEILCTDLALRLHPWCCFVHAWSLCFLQAIYATGG